MSELTDNSTQGRFLTTLEIKAPGKVILHGEHSVVYGKLAIAASINRQTSFRLNEHQSETSEACFIDLYMRTINLQLEINCEKFFGYVGGDLPLLSQPERTSYNFYEPENIDFDVITNKVKLYIDQVHTEIQDLAQRNAILAFLYVYIGMIQPVKQCLKFSTFGIIIDTDLSIGAGLGSSASFAVAIAAGFFKLVQLKQHNDIRLDMTHSDREVISRWAFQAERVMHGTPSGIDNMICTFGGLVKFRKSEQPQQLKTDPKKFPLECFLVDTKVPKNTLAQVEKVTRLKEEFPLLIQKVLDAMEEVALNAVQYLERLAEDSSDEVYRKLNSLVDVNHSLLKALGVSHPEIERVIGLLAGFDLHAKLTGAGGGGYVLCLVPHSFDEGVFDKVRGKVNGNRLKLGAKGVYCQLLDVKKV